MKWSIRKKHEIFNQAAHLFAVYIAPVKLEIGSMQFEERNLDWSSSYCSMLRYLKNQGLFLPMDVMTIRLSLRREFPPLM